MENPEKLATLGTQNTRRRQTKQKMQRHVSWLYPSLEFRCQTKPLDQYKTILVSFVHDFGEDVDRLHCSTKFCDGCYLSFFGGFVLLDLQFYVYVLQIVVCPFVLFLLANVLSVLLRYTLKPGGELRCSGMVSSFSCTSGDRCVNLVTNPVISHE